MRDHTNRARDGGSLRTNWLLSHNTQTHPPSSGHTHPEETGESGWVVLNGAHSDSSSLVHTALSGILPTLTERRDIRVSVPTPIVIFLVGTRLLWPHPLVAGPLDEATPLATPPVETGTIRVVG